MTRRRLFALLSVAVLLLLVAPASAAPAGTGGGAKPGAKGPRIKSGLYGSGDVYLDVNVKKRRVAFHFTLLLCRSLREPVRDKRPDAGQR